MGKKLIKQKNCAAPVIARKYCKVCKIELISSNAYSRSKTIFKPFGYCKTCDKKRRVKNYDPKKRRKSYVETRKFTLTVGEKKIQFNSSQEKRYFKTGRDSQAKGGHGHIPHSSRFGTSIWIAKQNSNRYHNRCSKDAFPFLFATLITWPTIKSPVNRDTFCTTLDNLPQRVKTSYECTRKWYEQLICPECGAVVRYDKHNEQVCSNCGLVLNDEFNVVIYEQSPDPTGDDKGTRSQVPIYEAGLHGDTSGEIDCYDKYYSRTHKKSMRRQIPLQWQTSED